MPQLHMSKVAVGCASLETLARRQAARMQGGVVPITTRFKPTRAEELIGGSLYWIIKHRVLARQRILGFVEGQVERKVVITLDPELVRVRMLAKRAHQGWRYFTAEDAPADLDGSEDDGMMLLPPRLAAKLAGLGLI